MVEQGKVRSATDKPICVGTRSADNDLWRPWCDIPMERTLGNRTKRRKTKGTMEMGQVSLSEK